MHALRRFGPALLFSSALLAAVPAFAAHLVVHRVSAGEKVRLADGSRASTAELQVSLDGERGLAYGAEIGKALGRGRSSHWSPTSAESSAGLIRAAWLVDHFEDDAGLQRGRGKGRARRELVTARQIAIWEAIADGANGGELDLHHGSFALADRGVSAGALALAQGLLAELAAANLDGFTSGAALMMHSIRPDQLVFTDAQGRPPSSPIPEPTSIVLFVVGAALVLEVVRRREA